MYSEICSQIKEALVTVADFKGVFVGSTEILPLVREFPVLFISPLNDVIDAATSRKFSHLITFRVLVCNKTKAPSEEAVKLLLDLTEKCRDKLMGMLIENAQSYEVRTVTFNFKSEASTVLYLSEILFEVNVWAA